MIEHFPNPSTLATFSREKMRKVNLYESPHMFCDVYCLLPGQSQAPHTHADSDKIYYGLTGECMVQIGEHAHRLEAGELAVAPAGVVHGVKNESDSPATLLVIMAPHPSFKG